jgi:ABC-2 type transport system permease protein
MIAPPPGLPPPGLLWLLRHELRLGLRLASGKSRTRRLVAASVLLSLPVGFGWFAARALAGAPDTPTPATLGLLVTVHAVILPLMASLAAVQVLRAFRDRNDLDLLLAAPLPPRRIFLAKALSVCALVAMPFLVLIGPFILFSVAHGHWRWGGTLLVLMASATIATALGFLLVSALMAWLGPRRARVAVHLGSALLGASIFIASQLAGLSGGIADGRAALIGRLATIVPPPPFDIAGRAMVGEALPLLALLGLAVAALLLSAGPGAARLARSSPDSAAVRNPGRALAFPGSPLTAMLTKELRLLWRDPETLAQVLLRFVYLVPLIALALRPGTDPEVAASQLLAGGVALATMAGSSLAWITLCAEEARELVEAAPLTARQRGSAKLALACGLPLLAVLPLVVWLLFLSPPAALLLLPLAALGAASMALIQGWHGPKQPRGVFRKRPRAMLLMGVVEITMAGLWALTAILAYGRPLQAVLPLAVALLALWLAFALREKPLKAPKAAAAPRRGTLRASLPRSS